MGCGRFPVELDASLLQGSLLLHSLLPTVLQMISSAGVGERGEKRLVVWTADALL